MASTVAFMALAGAAFAKKAAVQTTEHAEPMIPEWLLVAVIIACGVIGIIYSIYCALAVAKIKLVPDDETRRLLDQPRKMAESEAALGREAIFARIVKISKAVSEGATTFLFSEYKIMAVFIVIMFFILVVLLGVATPEPTDGTPWIGRSGAWMNGFYSGLSFVLGSVTSIAAGWIGMKIATYTNSRTTIMAERGYAPAFATAIQGGIVMGFALTSVGLLSLLGGIYAFWWARYSSLEFEPASGSTAHIELSELDHQRYRHIFLMEAIAPFGLGGSAIALFGRVGGGIFTKAADVGADLVGKVEQNIPEDDPRNPGVIADNVGDNVGDIAGMGSDLFGSFAEATCAALVVSTTFSSDATKYAHLTDEFAYLLFPLAITAIGIITCLFTTFIATIFKPPRSAEEIEPALKVQLVVSTVANTIAYLVLALICLPSKFYTSLIFMDNASVVRTPWHVYGCILLGLWSGLIIGLVTEYYTSHAHAPTRDVAKACRFGAATNVIQGLALGYESTIVPCICIAVSVWASMLLCGMYGVAMAALGILSTMAIGLTIDAYGPISDNAGGIAEMAGMDSEVRRRTDALDAAGNTTAAIGKGFAIGSAAFVGVALFGAYQTSVGISTVDVLDPRVFLGIILGAMLPYAFSAMTMKSVGSAAQVMVAEIQRQFRETPGLMSGQVDPDYERCISIATEASLREMMPPGLLVILSPILCGIFLGPEALSGLLPASMASGVMMAISAANTGGAWDNAKKYVEAGHMPGHTKGSDVHKAAVIGDTVGDPLKDTSGPALNILVKLMAILSVVFAPVFAEGAPLSGLIADKLVCGMLGEGFCPN